MQAKDAVTSNMWAGSTGNPSIRWTWAWAIAAPNGSTSGAPSVGGGWIEQTRVLFVGVERPGDTNGVRDIFLVDPLNPAVATQRISTDSTGTPLPGDSCEPRISADGNKVVFTISAPTLLFGTGARGVCARI